MEFFSLKKQYNLIKEEIDEAVSRVLDKGVFIKGEEVENFEKEMADFCNSTCAISVNSGTDALFLSLKALDIGPKDEVVTSPFTFIATAEVIANLGAKPVFVDINPETFNLDVSKVKEKINANTKAVIPVHLFGQPADMDEIMELAVDYNLSVVEDAAQAIGAEYKGKKAGSIADLGALSFFPSKNLGAFGDGGMILTNNKKLADKLRLLINHGSSPQEKYKNLILGINSRLDAVQAAILRVKLKYLDDWNKKRKEAADYYSKNLKEVGDIITPIIHSERSHVFHQYTIRTKSRDKLTGYLKEKGIPSMVYYPLALHLQPAFDYLGCKEGDFPETEKAGREVLSLPIYPELAKEEQDLIIKEIREFFKH